MQQHSVPQFRSFESCSVIQHAGHHSGTKRVWRFQLNAQRSSNAELPATNALGCVEKPTMAQTAQVAVWFAASLSNVRSAVLRSPTVFDMNQGRPPSRRDDGDVAGIRPLATSVRIRSDTRFVGTRSSRPSAWAWNHFPPAARSLRHPLATAWWLASFA